MDALGEGEAHRAATAGLAGRPIRIAFLIRSLEVAGAERQLVELARSLDRRAFAPVVLICYGGGALEGELRGSGVPLRSLDKRGRWDTVGFLRRLRQELRTLQPDIVHSYMTSANLFALAARAAVPRARIVWGMRQSSFDWRAYGFPLRILFAVSLPLERRLARTADLIIPNSQAAATILAGAGIGEDKIEVVPNGIDCGRFRPDPAARARLRAEWRLGDEATLVGLIGRLDPMKGHGVFLEAAARIRESQPDVRFVCVGDAREPLASQLRQRAEDLGLRSAVIWTGERHDMPTVYNALDLQVSASLFGEGFSNAVAEAMACGVPSVVTDVGDSAAIVGDCGRVVAVKDAKALAEACAALLALPARVRQELSAQCRERIVTCFSLEAMVARTSAIYRRLVGAEHVQIGGT